MRRIWRIWCKTMGDKISLDDREADIAAVVRTFFWLTNIVTCFFIIAGILRHWND
jgi:hypothetical protein